MKRILGVLTLMTIMFLGVTYAFADDHQHPGGPGQGGTHQHGGVHQHESLGQGKALDLTADQKTKLQDLHWKFDEETAQLKGALLTKRLELRALWRNPKADSKAILDKEKEMGNLQTQMREKVAQLRLEARKFLTPEQIAEFGRGWGMGHDFGQRHIMGGGRGMDRGMSHAMGSGMGAGMGQGMGSGGKGHGKGRGIGHGPGSGMGMCN